MSAPAYGPMMITGLHLSTLRAFDLDLNLAALDSAVDALTDARVDGSIVLVAGDPGRAWGPSTRRRAQYLRPYDVAPDKDRFGHWVVLFEIDVAGDFIVGDPLSKSGAFHATPAQLKTYLIDGKGLGGAIVVPSTPQKPNPGARRAPNVRARSLSPDQASWGFRAPRS